MTPGRRFYAKPVTNMLIGGNMIDRASGLPVEIHSVRGLFVHHNSLSHPDWLKLQDCEEVSVRDGPPRHPTR